MFRSHSPFYIFIYSILRRLAWFLFLGFYSMRFLVFFYIDDTPFAFRKNQETLARRLINQLKTQCLLTRGDELQWFLGVHT
jgi:hypothetical protein